MSFLKRAMLYLIRKRGRSTLLLIIIFVMSGFVLIGMALKIGADSEAENLRKSLGSSFALKANTNSPGNYETHTMDGYSYQSFIGTLVTDDMINKISVIDGIKDYAINSNELAWVDLKLKPGAWSAAINDFEKDPKMDYFLSREEVKMSTQSTILFPCRTGALHENFRTGALKIEEGRNIQSDDHYTAVISVNLAQRNGLSVGDTFTIESKEGLFQPGDDPFKTWGEPIKVTIVGLFAINFEQESSIYTAENQFVENLIYTDLGTGKQMESNRNKDSSANQYGDITFFVDDPQKLDSILAEIRNMHDLNLGDLLIKTDDTAYRASAKPLKQISTFALILMITGILGCTAILYLILKMWTKSRKQEIGILLSVGTKRRGIVFQMIVECMVVAVIALILSFVSSGIITDGIFTVAEHMTVPDKEEQSYTVEEGEELTITINKVSSESVHLEYHLTLQMIIFMIIATCGISAISVVLAATHIMRMKPKDILSTMS